MKWTNVHQRAAQLVADDLLSDEDIAATCGISKKTLERWKLIPDFTARVKAITETTAAALLREGIANRQNRVDALNDRWRRLQQVITERADDPLLAVVPGGTTGLLVRQIKQVGIGPTAQVVEEYGVDTATLREIRAHEEQAAKELGQWIERSEQRNTLKINFEALSDDELAALASGQALAPGAGPGRAGITQTQTGTRRTLSE